MKKRISFIIAVAMVLTCFWGIQVCEAKTELTSEKSVKGAEVPETPTVKAAVSDDSVKLTVSKTSGADGYGIYMKAPGAKKYSLIKTLTKNGTKKRNYTKKDLEGGKYAFKVRAYKKVDGKKVWGSYSKAVSVKVKAIPKLAKAIEKTPALIELDISMIYVDIAENTGDKSEIYYPVRMKKDVEAPQTEYVYRLYAILGDESDYDHDTPVIIKEKEIGIKLTDRLGSINLMVFGYANEEDADAKVNPLVRTDRVTVQIFNSEEVKKYADITFKNGYAYFGEYPQKKVKDSTVISALNSIAAADSKNVPEYKGKTYNYYEPGKYWCESEPIEWVILEGSADSDTVTLMSNRVLLECGYSSWDGYEAGGQWKDSFVRYHLNGYNGSFKNIWTREFFRVAFPGDMQRVLIEQNYAGCKDKVLLPSKKVLSKLTASERIRKVTDLTAKSETKGYWCIDSDGKGNITLVKPDGEFTTRQAWAQDGEGYVPVIKVDLKQCNITKR